MRKKIAENNQGEKALVSIPFEEALEKLEAVVKELERGELPLEQALDKFSAGVQLSQVCMARLNAADREIDKILREEQGQIVEYPLNLEEEV